MCHWSFPPAPIESTGCQNHPADAREYVLETAIVHIATCLKNINIKEDGERFELDCIDPLAWQRTGVVAADLGPLLETADAQVSLPLDTLLPRFSRSA